MKTDGTTKTCSRCREAKPLAEFGPDRSRVDGLHNYCRGCKRTRDTEYRRAWGIEPTPSDRIGAIGTGPTNGRTGMSPAQALAMKEAAGFQCQICGDVLPPEKLCGDHDHKTGLPRGVLCHRCNTGLGMFLDDPDRLASAIAYLLTTSAQDTMHAQHGG